MTWWTICCGDEGSVQSGSCNSPPAAAAQPPVALPSPRATESTPLLAQNASSSAAVTTKTREESDKTTSPPLSVPSGYEAKTEQPTCDDSEPDGEVLSEGQDTDAVAWNAAKSTLLQNCSSLPVSTVGDLLLSQPRDVLPPPTTMNHIAQLSTWDCGIACLEMVFDWLGIATGIDRQDVLERIPTRSVWSADLVQLLDERLYSNTLASTLDYDTDKDDLADAILSLPSNGFQTAGRYLFCSQTLSVNDDLNSFAYYQNTFENDRIRVGFAFQWLQERRGGSLLQIPSLPLNDVVELLLRPDCVAIVLVDNAILTGLRRADAVSDEPRGNVTQQEESGGDVASSGACTGPDVDLAQPAITASTSTVVYMGHYILLTGVVASPKPVVFDGDTDDSIDDDDEDEPFLFQVHNPSLDFGPVLLSPRLLDDARRAPGTDHDILFIVKVP